MRGPWVHTAVLEGDKHRHTGQRGSQSLSWALCLQEQIQEAAPTPALALILTESAVPSRALERRAAVCHTLCSRYDFAVGFDLWSSVIHN